MAKSLGNFFTLRDLLAKGFSGREVRYLLLTAHYRETFNFTMEGLQSARQSLARLDECLARLRELAGGSKGTEDAALLSRFSEMLDDDLNVSGAWGVIFDWVRDTNRRLADKTLDAAAAAAALATWEKIDSVVAVGAPPEIEVPAEIQALLEARQEARKAKDFKRSDTIRDELKAKGWAIEDTPKGPRLRRL
jgi:cysteinyl-tRNA synthetase